MKKQSRGKSGRATGRGRAAHDASAERGDQPDLLGWDSALPTPRPVAPGAVAVERNAPGSIGLRIEELLGGGHRFIARDLTQGLASPYREDVMNLILLLLLALEEGSLCLREGEIEGLLQRAALTQGCAEPAQIGAMALRYEAFLSEQFDACHESPGAPGASLFGSSCMLMGEGGLLVPARSGGKRAFYFRKHLESLSVIREGIARSFTLDRSLSVESEAMILREVLEDHPVRAGGQVIRFTDEQRSALEGGLRHSLFVLSGGPGTGKTTIILNLLRCLTRAGCVRIRLAAPTGKAAARMTESIQGGLASLGEMQAEDRWLEGLQPVTLHRLLGLRPGREEPDFGLGHPLDADVLVVDEVSMVDVVMMARLFRAVDLSRTRLVLIGDRDQLPSVEAGAVLADILDLLGHGGPGRSVLLTKGHRSQSAVRAASAWVNAGGSGPNPMQVRISSEEYFATSRREGQGRREWKEWMEEAAIIIERKSVAELPDLLTAWMSMAFTREYSEALADVARQPAPQGLRLNEALHPAIERLFECLNGSRVLTVLRRGPAGAEAWNRMARMVLAESLGAGVRGNAFAGLPILIQRNDSLRSLSNGETGLMVEFRGRRLMAIFRAEGGWVAYTPDVLPLWEPAFAMTVHKSQGSEYERVLLVLPDEEEHPLMTRQILYTGITRAKRLALLSGKRSAVVSAASRDWRRVT